MLDDGLNLIALIWRESLVGSAVIVVCVGIGWREELARRRWMVRAVSWWLEHIVQPLMIGGTWARRAATIAVNNLLVCATVVLLGSLGRIAWLGVAVLGLGLGIALRLLIAVPMDHQSNGKIWTVRSRILEVIGLVLNLLEVLAIMLTAGLSLAQGAMTTALSPTDAWAVFVCCVLPLLVIGAAGEALWMTVTPNLPSFSKNPSPTCPPLP